MKVKRTEHKFIINRMEALLLKQKLDKILPRDVHSTSEEGYEIRSLYFDTVWDTCCAEKEDGLRYHEKIRARIYGTDENVIKLESKRKNGEFQVKQTMMISKETLEQLCKGNYHVLLEYDNPLAAYFYNKLSSGMVPKNIIQYQRLSFCLNINNIRITFDSDVRATESCIDLFQDPLLAHPILPQNLVILEVKYNDFLLDYIKQALQSVEGKPSSFSKYFSGRSFYRHMI